MLSQRSMGSCTSSRMGEWQHLAPPALVRWDVGEHRDVGDMGCGRLSCSGRLIFPTRKYWTYSSFWKSGIQGAFSVADTWPGLPDTIDAVFQDLLTKRVFFFAGELCPHLPHPTGSGRSPVKPGSPQGCLTPPLSPTAGRQFWVFSGKSVLGPRGIEKLGIGKEAGRISGALQRGRGKVLLFSGENYWR